VPAPWTLVRWEVQYLEKVLDGRTRPLVLRCTQRGINPNPHPRSLVVKALGLPQVTPLGLICELFGNMLARDLGVLTATPALVEVDDDAAAALNMSLEERGLRVEPGLAVGSSYLRPLFPAIGTLPEHAVVEAPRLYGYDLAVQNPDRRPENPNCALFEDKLLAYDFELAFSFLRFIGDAAEAWEVTKHGLFARHVMYPRLRHRKPSWQPLIDSLRDLTVERLDQLVGHLPADWRGDVQRVRTHMVSLLESLSELERELRESVA
jgi:hypothetical protein